MPPDAPNAEPAFELRDVSKYFGDAAALRGIRLRIEAGDSVLIYGANGAGKTTLLRLLAALARPSEGRILFAGRDLARDSRPGKAAIGFLSHTTFLYNDLTARENLEFAGRLFGLHGLGQKITGALGRFGALEWADKPVRSLSRGLQQRVALARAFLHNPDFLLLDEPFTGLDSETRESLKGLLRQLREQGKTLIFSTHDFEQGQAIARRLVALDAGRVRYDGPLDLAPLAELRIEKIEK